MRIPDNRVGHYKPASPRSLDFALDLLRNRDLTASTKWVDATQAMDAEEYDRHLESIRQRCAQDQYFCSGVIEALKSLPRKSDARRAEDLPDVPAGRYAVDDAEGELRFYRVARSKRTGRYWIYVQHGPDESEIPFNRATYFSILGKIADDPAGAMQRYGFEIGSCGKCGLRLTNRISRELGIGPICGGRMFEGDWRDMERRARQAIVDRGEDPDEEVES